MLKNLSIIIPTAVKFCPLFRLTDNFRVSRRLLDASFGFTGHYYHAKSGLNLAPYRAYDAEIARWTSRDPAGETTPDGTNLYDYVRNDPLGRVDPIGKWGIAFGNMNGSYINFGWGDPTFLFTKDVGNDITESSEAFLDGINPFGDPFASHGFYNPCDRDLLRSLAIGDLAWQAETLLAARGAFGALGRGLSADAGFSFNSLSSIEQFMLSRGAFSSESHSRHTPSKKRAILR